MVNSQNVEKLWQAKDNIRLHGYNPSHAGESIRHEKGYRLDTASYEGEYCTLISNPANKRKLPVQNRLTALKQEMSSFLSYLRKYVEKNGKPQDREQNLATVDAVEKYCKTMFAAMNGHVQAFAAMDKGPHNAEILKNACVSINGVMSEFIDGMTEIYHGTFHSDEKLNIPFSHLVSTASRLKGVNAYTFQNYNKDARMVNVDLKRGNRLMISEYLNASYTFKSKGSDENGHEVEYSRSMDTAHLVGMLRTFGSLENGLMQAAIHQEKGKNAGTVITRKMATMEEFAKAEKYFFAGKKLTEKDYRFAFAELPKLEKAQKLPADQINPSDIYQSEVFNRIFPNVCTKLRKAAAALSGEEYKIEKNTDYIHAVIDAAMTNDLARPEAKEAMKQVKNALLPEVIENLQAEHTALDAAKVEQELNDMLYRKIFTSYMEPMLQDLGLGTGIAETGLSKEKGTAFYEKASQYLDSKQMNRFKKNLNGISVGDKINEAISRERPSAEVANGGV